MTKNDKLYRETLIRVGDFQMSGVDQLLENGHTGLAEKHTVSKLVMYIRSLESQLGINLPNEKQARMIRINLEDQTLFI